MQNRKLLQRIWIDVVGLLLPVLVLAGYVLGWSPVVTTGLFALLVVAVFSTRYMR
jgi:hypothetical protein